MISSISVPLVLLFTYIFSVVFFLAALQFNIATSLAALIFVSHQLFVCINMIKNCYFYSGAMNLFHLACIVLFLWVLYNFEMVVAQPYLDFTVFTDNNIRYAIQILVLCSLISTLVYVLFLECRPYKGHQTFDALLLATCGSARHWRPQSIFLNAVAAIAVTIGLFISNPSVLDIQYPYQRSSQWVPSRFLEVMVFWSAATLFLSYVNTNIVKQRSTLISNVARMSFLVVSIIILFLNGNRGLFVGVWLLFGACEIYLGGERARGSHAWGALYFLLAYLAYVSWEVVRTEGVYQSTFNLIESAFLKAIWSSPAGASQSVGYVFRISDIPTFSHMIFHLLYVINLIERGYSLQGATFLNLFPQLMPSFLESTFGERPLNDNWLLAQYFIHGGGFLVVANAYWNGGMLVLAIFMASLSSIFVALDRCNLNVETSVIYRAAYWIWFPVMAIQLGYGIQGLARVVEYLCAALVIDKLWRYYSQREFTRAATPKES